MKIIEDNSVKKWNSDRICELCNSKLEVLLEDIILGVTAHYGYSCPCCANFNIIHTGEIPGFHRVKLHKPSEW